MVYIDRSPDDDLRTLVMEVRIISEFSGLASVAHRPEQPLTDVRWKLADTFRLADK